MSHHGVQDWLRLHLNAALAEDIDALRKLALIAYRHDSKRCERLDGLFCILMAARTRMERQTVVFKPGAYDGRWIVGVSGAEREVQCDLYGVSAAHCAMDAAGVPVPFSGHPANSLRNSIREDATHWAAGLGCSALARAFLRVRVSGAAGTLQYQPAKDDPAIITA